jgi:dTDP-4-amino-4,6-dideoxygalactose transaminase
MLIPFNRPNVTGAELDCLRQVLEGTRFSGDGEFSRRCTALLEEEVGGRRVLLTPSCTAALELSAILLDLKPGDEVIIPSFTFVSTANAFVLRGATPVFVDVRPDTLNLDETRLEALITPRTRAIVPVHYAGVACEMDEIGRVAERHGVAIVEDNAQGLFGAYRGRALGTLGSLAAVSFHDTKNLTCGEGGALFVNDERLVERAEIVREKGTNRSQFLKGQVEKYTWVDIGSSFLLSDLLAAVLYAQLVARGAVQARREAIWTRYAEGLRAWAGRSGVALPTVPGHCRQTYHIFYLLLPSEAARDALTRHLREREIQTVFHYLPLNTSAMGRRFGGRDGDCPVSEAVSQRLLRLPLYSSLTDVEQVRVIDGVTSFSL